MNTHNMGITEMVREMNREELIEELVRNLIVNLKYTEEQTAEVLQLPVYRITEICKELGIYK